jgi:hypothetical protein
MRGVDPWIECGNLIGTNETINNTIRIYQVAAWSAIEIQACGSSDRSDIGRIRVH